MNEIIKAIKERRSVRKFKSEMPLKADIEQIIDAGLYAANAMGKQETAILAITNKNLRDRISALNAKVMGREKFDPFYGAPVILIVLGKKEWKNCVYDGSLVMGNLMLASHALGLGSIWIHRAKEEFESDEGKAILKELGIADEWEGIGHCAIGFADGDEPKAVPRKEGRVFWAE